MNTARALGLAVLILIISACANMNTYSKKSGYCNQLRSNLIFGGNTGNTRQADIQDAERPLTAKTYDEHCE